MLPPLLVLLALGEIDTIALTHVAVLLFQDMARRLILIVIALSTHSTRRIF